MGTIKFGTGTVAGVFVCCRLIPAGFGSGKDTGEGKSANFPGGGIGNNLCSNGFSGLVKGKLVSREIPELGIRTLGPFVFSVLGLGITYPTRMPGMGPKS